MGNLSEVSWKATDRTFRETVMISGGARGYWKFRKTAFHEGFQAYVESVAMEDVTEYREAVEGFLNQNRPGNDT